MSAKVALALVLCVASPVTAGKVLSGSAGGSALIDNRQRSLGLQYAIRTSGVSSEHLGEVSLWVSNYTPPGWTFAAGQELAIAEYPQLYQRLGTAWGGDGKTTFALPDLRGRVPIGSGNPAGLPARSVGEYVGSSRVQLTPSNLPSHMHQTIDPWGPTQPIGQGEAFTNLQDSAVVHFGMVSQRSDWDWAQPGTIRMYATADLPDDLIPLDGRSIPLTNDSESLILAASIGFRFGGDYNSGFKVPDLRGRTPVGAGGGWDVGAARGSEQIVLDMSNLPAHAHGLAGQAGDSSIGGSASPQPVDNEQPGLGLHFLVAGAGLYSLEGSSSFPQGYQIIGQVAIHAGRTDWMPEGWYALDGQSLTHLETGALDLAMDNAFGGRQDVILLTSKGYVPTTRYNLPYLRGRLAIGAETPDAQGESLGLGEFTLDEAQLPAHRHEYIPEPAVTSMLLAGAAIWLRRRGCADQTGP